MNDPNGIREGCPVLLQTGFRVFFLGAAFYSVVSVVFWMLFYVFSLNIFVAMPINVWHGHEMVYGYAMAVVAGFLLTAVTNWTGQKTLQGTPLLILFLLWSAGRIFALLPGDLSIPLMAGCDNIFLVFLIIAVTRPVVNVRQWKQFAVLSKIILVFISSLLFYLSLFIGFLQGAHQGLLFAFYIILSLVLTIGRRIIPFFVERGVGYPMAPRNSKVLDLSSLVLLILFSIIDVFWPHLGMMPVLAVLLAVVHTVRLSGWYTPGVRQKPLLWVLFAGYIFVIIGFILKALSFFSDVSPDSALHAFSYGGIGIFTLGMMARVSLGHTGRNIHEGPPVLSLMFILLIIGACVRVFLPVLDDAHYQLWIGGSQLLWMAAFTLFIFVYFPILTAKRIDGKFG